MWIPLLSGLLFGIGLTVSNMVNPQRVLAFLDPFGVWDPTLGFVMAGALAITIPGFSLVLKREKPWFSEKFALPTKKEVDAPLITGAAIFGLGWGLVGLCPGPAITALVSLDSGLILFCTVMLFSWLATDRISARTQRHQEARS